MQNWDVQTGMYKLECMVVRTALHVWRQWLPLMHLSPSPQTALRLPDQHLHPRQAVQVSTSCNKKETRSIVCEVTDLFKVSLKINVASSNLTLPKTDSFVLKICEGRMTSLHRMFLAVIFATSSDARESGILT